MPSVPRATNRPLSVTAIALFQGALSVYCIAFALLALNNPPQNLGLLRSALRLLIGQTDSISYLYTPREEKTLDLFLMVVVAVVIASYSAAISVGLWQLKAWARHAAAAAYAGMLIGWARGFYYFAFFGGFSHTSAKLMGPVYWVVLIEAVICLTLYFHGGVAEAFGEVE